MPSRRKHIPKTPPGSYVSEDDDAMDEDDEQRNPTFTPNLSSKPQAIFKPPAKKANVVALAATTGTVRSLRPLLKTENWIWNVYNIMPGIASYINIHCKRPGWVICPEMESYVRDGVIHQILGTLEDINLDLLTRDRTIHSQHLHDCNSLPFLPRHESTPASFVISSRTNNPRAYARRHQEVA